MSAQILPDIGEWHELESDPGLFTLLCEEFKVTGVEVEDIYDLENVFEFDACGFIFLFKWTDERKARRSRYSGANDSSDKVLGSPNAASSSVDMVPSSSHSKTTAASDQGNNATSCAGDEPTDSSDELFFAHQIVTNSCATHALLSILLNSGLRPNFHLGELLSNFLEFTRKMTPEDRGYAIGSTPELVEVHNRHARPERKSMQEPFKEKSSTSSKPSPTLPNNTCMQKQEDGDAFHYVSFVPVNGRLMELDGLRELPVDHGPLPADGNFWTEHFRRLIRQRVGLDQQVPQESESAAMSSSNDVQPGDIRYNLMAVVPDKRIMLKNKMNILRTNMMTIHETVEDLVSRCERESGAEEVKMELLSSVGSPVESSHDESEMPFSALKEQVEKIKDSPLKVSVTQVVDTGFGDRPLMQPCTTVATTDITKPLHIAVAETAGPSPDVTPVGLAAAGAPAPVITSSPSALVLTPNTSATGFSPTPSPSSMASATTSRSKYSTRSSTRLNTLASNSLANARADMDSLLEKFRDLKTRFDGSQCNSLLADRPFVGDKSMHKGFSPEELLELAQAVYDAIKECDTQLREQEAKRKRYLLDDERRRHDYYEFIHTFVHMLVESDRWNQLEQELREREAREQRDHRDATGVDNQSYDHELRVRTRRPVRRKNGRPVNDLRRMKQRSAANKKTSISHPILLQKYSKGRLDTHILVIWDDQTHGVCHYIKKEHLRLIDSNMFCGGTRVAYPERTKVWIGRVPYSFAEVQKICASEDAEVDLEFESERQVLVMWDDTTEGACDYVNTELLNILDGSSEIGRGTRVSMLWNKEEWTGQVPFVDERLSK